MTTRLRNSTLLALTAALACGPAMPDDESSPTRTPALMVARGGTAGGAIAGWVTIFVADENAAPIIGARVVVSEKTIATNEDGAVDFQVAKGPITAHLFVDGHPPLSVVGLDARSATFIFPSKDSTPHDSREPTIARVAGIVSGWDRLPPLAATSSTVFSSRFAEVQAVPLSSEATFVEQDFRQDAEGIPTNYAIGGALEGYSVKVDAPTTSALYALGGLDTFDWSDESFDIQYTHLGVLLDLELEAGDTIDGRNIDLSHELEPVGINVRGLPEEMNQLSGILSLNLPRANGTLFLGELQEQDGLLVANGPVLDGLLDSASYKVDVHVADETRMSSLQITQTDRTIVADTFLLPPTEVSNESRTLRARFSQPTGWQGLSISRTVTIDPPEEMLGDPELPPEDLQVQQTLWAVVDFSGDASLTIELPNPPEGFIDPLKDGEVIQASQISVSKNPNDSTFDALFEDVSRTTSLSAPVSF